MHIWSMGGLMLRHIYIVLLRFILTSASSSFLFGWWLVSKWERIERGGLLPGHMTVLNGGWSLWDGRREGVFGVLCTESSKQQRGKSAPIWLNEGIMVGAHLGTIRLCRVSPKARETPSHTLFQTLVRNAGQVSSGSEPAFWYITARLPFTW